MNLLLDSALKATVILFAAWAAALLLRRASADVRHTVWLVAMLAVAMVPAALSIPQSAIPQAARLTIPAIATGQGIATRRLPWLLLIWSAGASLIVGRFLLGIAAAVRITRSARLVNGILYSDRAQTPMTWGFFRPAVILPAYAEQWSGDERDLVMRHEEAHIARRDWLWQTLASLLTAVFWFHPLMWIAGIQLRREAENAADDLVLSRGAAPSDYAGRLVAVARHLTIAAPVAVLPMVRKPELETRVRSILDASRRRASAGLLVRCAILLAAAALIVPIAVTRQKVHAQDRGTTQPRILYKVQPEYTKEAQDDRIEGTVVLRAEITPAGTAENIKVMKSLDPGLDANAVKAVSGWQFEPGTKNGEPVTVMANIEVNFHLK